MEKHNTTPKQTTAKRTIGLDLGDRSSRYCLLDEQGDVIQEGSVATTKERPGSSVWSCRAMPASDGGWYPLAMGEPISDAARL
jgi:activator of 2-hydroxyglutaryl-CoA dehydratase